MKKIGLVTCRKLPQLTDDDRLLTEPLSRNGVSASPVVWDQKDVTWQEFTCVVLRSCWDYHTRLDEFLNWLELLEKQNIPILNTPDLIRWNCSKRYLLDLEAKGIPIVPTVFLERGAEANVGHLLKDRGWLQGVIKPTVSATAYQTWLTSPGSAEDDQAKLKKMLTEVSEVMVQPFLEEIHTLGEWSFMFFDGRFSHAVLKKPKAGDFRVQSDFGGQTLNKAPSEDLIKQAESVLHGIAHVPLYARVDGLEIAGKLIVMELELIEPAMFLGICEAARAAFASAISQRLNG